MSPLCTESLKLSSLGTLNMGTAVICVKTRADVTLPTNCLVSWSDGDSVFHLLPQHDYAREKGDQSLDFQDEPEYDLIYEAGSASAVWTVGSEAICKVHAWKEGIQLESETIAFIREHFPTISVPEVLYEWVDKSMNRSFLIMKRIHAHILEVAWPQLSHQQRLNIAKEVADYTVLVANKTSRYYQTISGCGVAKPWLMQGYDFDGPIHSWFPRTIGPFSGPELRAHWTNISTTPPPAFDEPFVLYHDDQCPTNILVSDSGDNVAAIIDWANVAYCPCFWVATAPLTVGGFGFENGYENSREWAVMLAEALKMQGFEECVEEVRNWSKQTSHYDTEDDKLEWSKVQLNAHS
jgi:hypothetical protein